MSDYTRVTFSVKLQKFGMESFVQASDRVQLRKACDPRRPGEGLEVLTDDGCGNVTMEFVSIELIQSITFAPVKGAVAVAEGAQGAAQPKAAK